jgi:hypothetical protein
MACNSLTAGPKALGRILQCSHHALVNYNLVVVVAVSISQMGSVGTEALIAVS